MTEWWLISLPSECDFGERGLKFGEASVYLYVTVMKGFYFISSLLYILLSSISGVNLISSNVL